MIRHRFYVGTHDKHGKRIKRGVGPEIARRLTARFGGVTLYRTEGQWRDDTGQIKAERAVVYECLGSGSTFRGLAARIRDLAGQACVLYTHETVRGEFV